jgi:hypothetical protein
MPSRLTKLAAGTAAAGALAALPALPTSARADPAADLNLQFGATRDIFVANDPVISSDNVAIPLGGTVTMQQGGSLNLFMAGTNHQPVIYRVQRDEAAAAGLAAILRRADAAAGTGGCVTAAGGCANPADFPTALANEDRAFGHWFLGSRTEQTRRVLGEPGQYVVFCNNPHHSGNGPGRNMRIVIDVTPAVP